eukprot:Sspe_Gene.106623::Locus_84697_Transcript_1_1_Confidence_1.000_Length_720::g.106623::m.106623
MMRWGRVAIHRCNRRGWGRWCSAAGGGRTAPQPQPQDAANPQQQGVWDDCDTTEDIYNAMAHEGLEEAEVTPEHYALAVRALAYGTVLAFGFVLATSSLARWWCGFTSWSDVAAYLQAAPDRNADQLARQGVKVYRHTIDLTSPMSWSESWAAITADIEKIREENADSAAEAVPLPSEP